MLMLFCETCNTLHRKYEHTIHRKLRTTIGPEGYATTRKLEVIEKYFCPLNSSHKIKMVTMKRIDNKEERQKFNNLFKPANAKHKKEYKNTISKYCSFIDFNEYNSQELLEFRNMYFK